MPSLVVAALPVSLLVSLRDRLCSASTSQRTARPNAKATSAPLAASGFLGWHSIDGASADTPAAAAGAATAGRVSALETGFAGGHASCMDARLAVQMVLLWKCQLDDTALEIVGGCAALRAVRRPFTHS